MSSKKNGEEIPSAQLGAFFDYLKIKERSSILIRAMESDYAAALEKNDERKLRKLGKEMRELMRETFSPEQRMEFSQFLKGRGIERDEDLETLFVDKLLVKKKISTREEFDALMAFVNENAQNEEFRSQIETANRLLHQFSLSKKKSI